MKHSERNAKHIYSQNISSVNFMEVCKAQLFIYIYYSLCYISPTKLYSLL